MQDGHAALSRREESAQGQGEEEQEEEEEAPGQGPGAAQRLPSHRQRGPVKPDLDVEWDFVFVFSQKCTELLSAPACGTRKQQPGGASGICASLESGAMQAVARVTGSVANLGSPGVCRGPSWLWGPAGCVAAAPTGDALEPDKWKKRRSRQSVFAFELCQLVRLQGQAYVGICFLLPRSVQGLHSGTAVQLGMSRRVLLHL